MTIVHPRAGLPVCITFAAVTVLTAVIAQTSCANQSSPVRTPSSGINAANMDQSVRAQDDLYRYANGGWLARSEIPPYLPNWSAGSQLQLSVYANIRSLLEQLVAAPHSGDADQRKLADLYATYMDEKRIDADGLAPVGDEIERIERIHNSRDLVAALAHLIRIGISVPISIDVHPDSKEADTNIVDLGQSGLALPDRDYYLSDEERFREIRGKYRIHIQRILELAGDSAATDKAEAILALEKKIAEAHWTAVANQDAVATYNRFELRALHTLAPQLHWETFLTDAGVAGRTQWVLVSQPSYFTTLGRLVESTSIDVWRAYLRFKLIDESARFLPKPFADESFEFYGKTLSGITATRPRWLRAVGFLEDTMGDALGRLYVEEYFPAQAKARAQQLLENLLTAFRNRIDTLDWMGPQSKREAQAKLASIRVKLGYPDRWRDYSELRTSRSSLFSNISAVREFAYARKLEKIGKPIDRSEWSMPPQVVNGNYSSWRNEVTLPAALMQPPYFQTDADDAVNYGGLGWFIAHELSHAFDNRGSQFDARGVMRDWMTKEDHNRFSTKMRALVEQYSHYEAAPGFFVNGELTVGENIADVSGLAIAYEAYQLSLAGREPPVLDGMTGPQRFFVSFATIWAAKDREADAIARNKSDTHTPPRFRVRGSVVNEDAFHAAFSVKPGDGMYKPSVERVRVW